MSEEECIEVRFLVGSGSIEEYAAFLAQREAAEAADDEEGVEFVSPIVPGRGSRPRSEHEQDES
jgi:hypothetical protein